MSYTFEQLKDDVRKEAEALKIHATKEEREALDFDLLSPLNIRHCIYGQMTGNCYSHRAAELIKLCCVRFFKHDIMPYIFSCHSNIENIQKGVNGAIVEDFIKERTQSNAPHFSAIEAYILLPEANNANLISFLRGETETLEL